ncbi:MAG: hypothetical protein WAX07_04540 [Candidatus Altiarchaeia archaeon]|jgi:hypothetical protein
MAAPKNPETRNVLIGIGITLFGISLFFLPIATGMDGMNGGFALMFLAIALVIPAGIITTILYGIRALTLQRILSGKDLIVHWTYTPGEWKKYAGEEHVRETSAKMALFYVLVFFSVLIGGGLFFVADDKEAAVIVLFGLFGLIIFIRLLIYFSIKKTRDDNIKYLGEAYIGRKGVCLNKSFHSWNFLSQLESARIDVNQKILEIEYSSLSRQGKDYSSVRIPIPSGKEDDAKKVLSGLLKDRS